MSRISYSSVVGSLMYVMICTHLDISYAISIVSKYMAKPGKQHWKVVQWIIINLCSSINICLQFVRTKVGAIGYADNGFAGNLDKRPLTCYVLTAGGCGISQRVALQSTITLSIIELNMSITKVVKEAIWQKGLFAKINRNLNAIIDYCDSQSAIFSQKIKLFIKVQSTLM